MNESADLATWVAVWLLVGGYLAFRYWRAGQGVGLVLCYVVSFGAIHWLAPLLNLLPWGESRMQDLIAAGMRESAIAMLMFAVGAEFVRVLHARARPVAVETEARVAPAAVHLYLAAGLFLHVVLFPLARGIPSIAALVATGSTLVVVAIGLKCWIAWQAGDRKKVWFWLVASTALPFFTVATQGFLGYGLAAMMTVYAFVAAFYAPRWKVLVSTVALGYLGLSVYVTYMRDREDIRAVVWRGGSLDDRLQSVVGTLSEFEWFDPFSVDHLRRVDVRLNQNFLIGAAVDHFQRTTTPFALGTTVVDALYAVIPRALWPDKPMSAGSGDLVSTYTGLTFGGETSVGIGQVLELYVNFGRLGVALGFLCIGALVVLVDYRAFAALSRGDVRHFNMWFLPGLSLLQLGGSFVEATSTAAASLGVAASLGFLASRFISQPRPTGLNGDWTPARPGPRTRP